MRFSQILRSLLVLTTGVLVASAAPSDARGPAGGSAASATPADARGIAAPSDARGLAGGSAASATPADARGIAAPADGRGSAASATPADAHGIAGDVRLRVDRPLAAGLAVGGLTLFETGAGASPSAASTPRHAVPGFLRAWQRLPERPEVPREVLVPHAIGDRLVIGVDDGFEAPFGVTHEARLDVAGGVSGPADVVAVRYPSWALAQRPPFRISGVRLGVTDLSGRATWPAVGVAIERAAEPLQPPAAPEAMVADVDTSAALGAPAPGQGRPADFARVAIDLPDLDVMPAWLSDGSFADDFERPNGSLDNPTSDWLECQGVSCGGLAGLQVDAGRVVRTGGDAAVTAIKFQAGAVAAVRSARDLDVLVSVAVDVSDPLAERAGLALRALAPNALYRVELVAATGDVEVIAETPGGPDLLDTFSPAAPASAGLLEVEVEGVDPVVSITVSLDGVELGTATDAVHRYDGVLGGLSASSPTGRGEAWDDHDVLRRPDVFVSVAYPAGEDVGLALDVSDDALVSRGTFVSADGGATFAPRALRWGCVNPGNPMVEIEVEETEDPGNLFAAEAKIVSLALDCATCRLGETLCSENASIDERRTPVATAGEEHVARVAWRNEHLDDGDSLIFRASVWDAPCDAPSAGLLVEGAALAGPDAGQPSSGAAIRSADVLRFTPPAAGLYCVVVEELHDLNGDCCPDGRETTPVAGAPCPGACTPAPGSDSSRVTSVVVRDVEVFDPCTPEPANLDPASLRVTAEAGEDVLLSWDVLDPRVFPGRFHLHEMRAGRHDRDLCFLDVAPVVAAPLGVTERAVAAPAEVGGPAWWWAIFETDQCPRGASQPDDSLIVDPGALCTP